MDGMKIIFQRIADFFDLSFFISGVMAVAAIAFFCWLQNFPPPGTVNIMPMFKSLESGWIPAIGLLVISYISGMVCFAIGRFIRSRFSNKKDKENFLTNLKNYGLDTHFENHNLLDKESNAQYAFMTTILRNSPQHSNEYRNLEKFWVLAATYDGVAVALIIWGVAFLLNISAFKTFIPSIPYCFPIGCIIFLLISAIFCFREADRCGKHQRELLVAAFAAANLSTPSSRFPLRL